MPYTTNRELFASETDVFAQFASNADALENPELRALMQRIGAALEEGIRGLIDSVTP